MLLLPLPLSEESRAERLEEMNQHGSFLCEELLPCPISILEAAPATLLLLEGTQALHPEHERGESGGEREREKDGKSLR